MEEEREITSYFTVDRNFFESSIWQGSPWRLKIWLLIIGRMRVKPGQFLGIQLQPGDFCMSIRAVAKAVSYKVGYRIKKPSPATIFETYEEFAKDLRITKRTEHGLTVISVCNYEKYRPNKYDEANNEANGGRTIPEQKKKYKEDKKNLNNNYSIWAEEVVALYNDMRPDGWPMVTDGKKVRVQIIARIKEDPAREIKDWWGAYFNQVNASTLVTGDWFNYGSLEWITKKENMNEKILKGKYDPRGPIKNRPPQNDSRERLRKTMENLAGRSIPDDQDGQGQRFHAADDTAGCHIQPKLLQG